MDFVLWVHAWQLQQITCWGLCKDWSLDHYKLLAMGDVRKRMNLLREGYCQVNSLIWLSGQATGSSSANGSIDQIVLTELLRRNLYYSTSICENCWTHVLDNANVFYACLDHYDTAVSLARGTGKYLTVWRDSLKRYSKQPGG